MKALFSSDWQCSFENIEECTQAWSQLLLICKERKIPTVVLLGDLKQQYSPVDVRVVNFWSKAITIATEEHHLRVIVVLGNHDRVGLYSDAQSWLPTLRRVGAEVYDKPTVVQIDDDKLGVLPFTNSIKRLKKFADDLASNHEWDGNRDILCFHADVKGGTYNKLQGSSSNFKPAYFHPEKYRAVIGGHLHEHQLIGKNVFYTGSPFCSDWGEANQTKGFLLVLDDDVEFVKSKVPGWYDPTWPGFKKRKSWKDARVRIHVHCSPKENYLKKVEDGRKKAQEKYEGATIYTVTEFEEESSKDDIVLKDTDSDEKKIRVYVGQTVPSILRGKKQKIVSYLTQILDRVSKRLRTGSTVRFKKFVGENILSFKNLEIDFEQGGIVVVKGVHKDWPGRSNGSGKTSYLSAVPITMFGTTFKKQKCDSWARRQTDKQAKAVLYFNINKKKAKVKRCRRPCTLSLTLDGVDQSEGMRNNSKDGTQGLVELTSGFTWQTLANAVYIDQTVTNAFLSGTYKARTDVLAKFQNLERFAAGIDYIKADQWKSGKLTAKIEDAICTFRSKIAALKASIHEVEAVRKSTIHEVKNNLGKAKSTYHKLFTVYRTYEDTAESTAAKLSHKIEKANEVISRLVRTQGKISESIDYVEREIERYKRLLKKGRCPTCRQTVSREEFTLSLIGLKKDLLLKKKWKDRVEGRMTRLVYKSRVYEADYDSTHIALSEKRQEVSLARNVVILYRKELALAREARKKDSNLERLRVRLLKVRHKKNEKLHKLEILERRMAFYTYCLESFSRNGIPAFLNAQLCPVLNNAAKYYSHLFADGQIKVRFEMKEGELEPVVLNPTGGENIKDQSVGELAMAGLITSFSLREVAPKCNILILDEPGSGLDVVNARKFAAGLKELKSKFSTIFVTSHNQAILEELASEKQLTIEKQSGISRVI